MKNVVEDAQKREHSYTAGGNANWCRYYGKQHRGTSENKQTKHYHTIQQFYSWVYSQKKKQHSFENIYAPQCSIISKIQDMEAIEVSINKRTDTEK